MRNIWMILITMALLFSGATLIETNNALEKENIQLQAQVAACELALAEPEDEQECFIQAPTLRYESLILSDADITYAALCAYHESRGEPWEGIRAVVEVILNRAMSEKFPNTVQDVIYDEGQFDCSSYLTSANITEPDRLTVCYDAVNYVLHNDDYVLDADYGYFKSTPYTSCSYIQIGNHYFAKM